MVNGKQIVEEFIRTKSLTGDRSARQRWHGQFLGVERSSEITLNMFLEIENYINSSGWFAYGWAAKRQDIARRLYLRNVSQQDYSLFPPDQNHWDAFYCSRDVTVAEGYRLPGTCLLRIYVKRTKIGNIWLSDTHLGKNVASALMVAAKCRTPALSFFGLDGPQSQHINEPEMAMFGSQITANTLCIPLPESITNAQVRASHQLSRTAHVQQRPYAQFEQFLRQIS